MCSPVCTLIDSGELANQIARLVGIVVKKDLSSTSVLVFDLICVFKPSDNRVIVVIGGDDNYKNAAEEEKAVLSRWAKRQISSQFKEEFIDGRISFIFSWNKEHRPIHEEAMLHFLDPGKRGEKFEPKPQLSKHALDAIEVRLYNKSHVRVKSKIDSFTPRVTQFS